MANQAPFTSVHANYLLDVTVSEEKMGEEKDAVNPQTS
jgi:hypothetical protein